MNLVAGPVFGLIDLIIFDEGSREVANGWEVRIFVDDRSVKRHPGMLIEPSSDHLSIFWPFVVGVERGMHSNEAFTVLFDERDHVFLLGIVEVQLAGGADENDGVEVVEILRVAI